MNDRLIDKSVEHGQARRIMRKILLALDTPNAKQIKEQYYETITLAEHEAARRALSSPNSEKTDV